MRLYSGTSKQFIEDTTRNQIAEKLENAFFSLGLTHLAESSYMA